MESRPSRWDVYTPLPIDRVKRIQAELAHLQLSDLVVQLLANRDITEPSAIDEFMQPPDVSAFPSPERLQGMIAAVDRICAAIDNQEKIVVYGDFDADGVTSTALLTLALRQFGATVEPYVPNRMLEGYGLNANAVKEIAARGATLLITVDCGISGRPEVAYARDTGLDVIVTDHHHLPDDLPEAAACINPKQYVEGCECYQDLAGVGVAYQLVRALVLRRGKPKSLRNLDLLGLVAIGTVADIVPLKGANRSLVAQGIAALPQHSLPGIHKLLEYAHVKIDGLDTERIGFTIGPRLNAAGRMDDARIAYELLMTGDSYEASRLAQKLEAQNRQRRAVMSSVQEQARERAQVIDDRCKLILVSDGAWQPGVVGLVASRLVEEFGRPAFVLSEEGDECRGSARSIPGFSVVEALTQVKDLLVRFGGHSMAAGFTVKKENVEELNRRLCEIADGQLTEDSMHPIIKADAELKIDQVCDATLDSISSMSPFGSGNPLPLFLSRNVRVVDVSTMGDGAHLKLMLAGDSDISGRGVEAIAFRYAHLAEAIRRRPRVDVLYHIERREWRNTVHIQAKIRDVRLSPERD